jgi:UDP-N-acetylglucosamine/UDP-N-acetylgalactosamine 4-epimerase
MSHYDEVVEALRHRPRRWLVTGAAGFIGSHLVEKLLAEGQTVVGLDNFATGHRRNLDAAVGGDPGRMRRFRFVEADIRDPRRCREACQDVDVVLHHAALGSVPRSIEDPVGTNASNVDGFLHMLVAARDAEVTRFVYAASSSTYGDHPALPKVEDQIGRPLSPYAVTKYVNELYADVFARTYGVRSIGLRYFNVFGRRQDPAGAYAAVIPRWVAQLLAGAACEVNGDGETTRDFCHVDNVVQANLLAATTTREEAMDEVYNVACGDRTTLLELFRLIRDGLADLRPGVERALAVHRETRPGDVRHSQADIGKIRSLLEYEPIHTVATGLAEALPWYASDLSAAAPAQVPVPRIAHAVGQRPEPAGAAGD